MISSVVACARWKAIIHGGAKPMAARTSSQRDRSRSRENAEIRFWLGGDRVGYLMHGVVGAATVTPLLYPGLACRTGARERVRRRIVEGIAVPPPRATCPTAHAKSAPITPAGSSRLLSVPGS